MIGAIGGGMSMTPVASCSSAASPSPATPPGLLPQVDRAEITMAGQAMLNGDLLATLLVLALHGKSKNEHDLSGELGITLLVLKALAEASPYIKVEMVGGETMYSMATNMNVTDAMAMGNVASLFQGGIGAIVGAMGAGGMG